jgi:hypothetical protein
MPVPVVLPVTLPELPDLGDHHIGGKPTVPAVELLELLVQAAAAYDQDWVGRLPSPLAMTEVSFPRFLPADEIDRCTFEVALERGADSLHATLTSRIALGGGLRRVRVHADARLGRARTEPPSPPPALDCDFEVTAERVYRELVPFGPRYRNLRGVLRLGPRGGMARVRSPMPPRQPPPLCGCPYLLDAAMHLACLWGQRFAGYVAYPTGFATRVLVKPTAAGERRCILAPTTVAPRRVGCNLWLLDEQGELCDAVLGLAMSPLAASAPAPAWINLAGERA